MMKGYKKSSRNRYEIEIEGRLEEYWSASFERLVIPPSTFNFNINHHLNHHI